MVDRFTLALLGTVALASLLPVRGEAATALAWITNGAIAFLFFLHGAKLSREAILAGLGHVRLHAFVVVATFGVFPLVGLLLQPVATRLLPAELATGLLFLCVLPATVQSAIAFTSIARGNVPAAICSSSASTLLGLFLTPLLARAVLGSGGGMQLDGRRVLSLVGQILVPFVIGHLLRPRVAGFLAKRAGLLGITDRGSILLVVYGAFSASVTEGLWKKTSAASLAILGALCLVLLIAVLVITTFASRAFGFSKEDEITAVFCGSKKSLASGIPMARVLFPAAAMGAMVLPLMVFHQLQLMVCSAMAGRYGGRVGLDSGGGDQRLRLGLCPRPPRWISVYVRGFAPGPGWNRGSHRRDAFTSGALPQAPAGSRPAATRGGCTAPLDSPCRRQG